MKPTMPVVLVVDSVRSMYNVGSLFRTAEAVGIQEVILCGMTAFPPRHKINKVARGMEQQVAWSYFQDSLAVVRELKQKGFYIIALEQTAKSQSYLEVVYSFPTALVVGFEVLGISPSILEQADMTVDIPMFGIGKSLNVTVAFGTVVYEIRRQWQEKSCW